MPDLNIRNLDVSLLRDVNVAAAKADLTQRDWVIGVLRFAAMRGDYMPLASRITVDGAALPVGRSDGIDDVVHARREGTGEADKSVKLAPAKPDADIAYADKRLSPEPETSRPCPICKKRMLPWGAMMRCQGCNRNF